MKSMLVLLVLTALAVAEATWWAGHGAWAGHHGALPLPVHDTPEVAAAKAAHFAAVAHAGGHVPAVPGVWGVPGVPAPVHDTPEVAAAKAAHLAAHHAVASGAGLGYAGAWAHGGDDGQWHGEGLAESQDHGHWNGAGAWAGPWAGAWAGHGDDGQWHGEGLAESQDHGHWNGLGAWGVYGAVHETPAVAAARAAHLAAHAAAAHRWRRSAVLAVAPFPHVVVPPVVHPLVRSHIVTAHVPVVHSHWW